MTLPSNENEYRFETPEVFKGLSRVRYGETRRDPDMPTPLSGNTTDSPALLGREYDRAFPGQEHGKPFHERAHSLWRTNWIASQQRLAKKRIAYTASRLGLSTVGMPRAAHNPGIAPVKLRTAWQLLNYTSDYANRKETDATLSDTQGFGSIYTPADCVVANIVYVRRAELATAQIHAGRVGLMADFIGMTLSNFTQYGLKPNEASIYVSPYLQSNYIVENEYLRELETIENYEQFISGDPLCPEFDMGKLAVAQLTEAGVSIDNIELSPDDTWSNPSLYSHRQSSQDTTKPIGRFGVMFGLAA